MSQITGTVIEKAYHPPPGAPDKYWCYIMIELESGKRANIRLHQKVHDKVAVGDRISLTKSWRKNKRVKDVKIIT